MSEPTAMVIGTGFIGAPVIAALLARGYAVRGFNRRAQRPPCIGAHDGAALSVRALDLLRDDPRVALGPGDVWIACYASGGHQDRRALYVDGARALVEAAARHRPGRVVYTSSTSALPDVDAWLDETTAQRPTGERGAVQRDAEDVWRDGLAALGIPLTILRLAGLYGPGRELGRLYLRRPEEPMRGHGHQPTNLVHRDDAVTAVLAAATVTPPVTGVVHVCDDDHRTRREMVDALARRVSGPTPQWEAPPPAGRPVGKRVANERMKQLLGVELRHPSHAPA